MRDDRATSRRRAVRWGLTVLAASAGVAWGAVLLAWGAARPAAEAYALLLLAFGVAALSPYVVARSTEASYPALRALGGVSLAAGTSYVALDWIPNNVEYPSEAWEFLPGAAIGLAYAIALRAPRGALPFRAVAIGLLAFCGFGLAAIFGLGAVAKADDLAERFQRRRLARLAA